MYVTLDHKALQYGIMTIYIHIYSSREYVSLIIFLKSIQYLFESISGPVSIVRFKFLQDLKGIDTG